MGDFANRLARRVQLTTDGHKPYLQAVDDAFGNEIDYATLVKLYGPAPDAQNPDTYREHAINFGTRLAPEPFALDRTSAN